jgi:hypothetical protein
MNPGLGDNHPAILYYDGDYPSPTLGEYPENFDEATKCRGLAFDLQRYKELAAEKRRANSRAVLAVRVASRSCSRVKVFV